MIYNDRPDMATISLKSEQGDSRDYHTQYT